MTEHAKSGNATMPVFSNKDKNVIEIVIWSVDGCSYCA